MIHSSAVIRSLSIAICSLLITGCGGGPAGPKISPVTGKVTLDGAPLAEALVEFIPEQGRPSSALTDANGMYDLVYTQQEKGAIVGAKYRVKIAVGREEGTSEGVVVQKAVPERVPERYNKKTELTAEVDPKPTVIDFDLKSK